MKSTPATKYIKKKKTLILMKLSIKGPRISVVRSSLKSFIIHLLTFSLSLHSIVSNINSSYKLESLSIEEKKKRIAY